MSPYLTPRAPAGNEEAAIRISWRRPELARLNRASLPSQRAVAEGAFKQAPSGWWRTLILALSSPSVFSVRLAWSHPPLPHASLSRPYIDVGHLVARSTTSLQLRQAPFEHRKLLQFPQSAARVLSGPFQASR